MNPLLLELAGPSVCPAFGARARFYGWMSVVCWSNIRYPEVALELSPLEGKMRIEMKDNRFYIPEMEECLILNTMKMISRKHHLGDDTDILIRYQPSDKWQFAGIFGYFNSGYLEQIDYKAPNDAILFSLQALFTLN